MAGTNISSSRYAQAQGTERYGAEFFDGRRLKFNEPKTIEMTASSCGTEPSSSCWTNVYGGAYQIQTSWDKSFKVYPRIRAEAEEITSDTKWDLKSVQDHVKDGQSCCSYLQIKLLLMTSQRKLLTIPSAMLGAVVYRASAWNIELISMSVGEYLDTKKPTSNYRTVCLYHLI